MKFYDKNGIEIRHGDTVRYRGGDTLFTIRMLHSIKHYGRIDIIIEAGSLYLPYIVKGGPEDFELAIPESPTEFAEWIPV